MGEGPSAGDLGWYSQSQYMKRICMLLGILAFIMGSCATGAKMVMPANCKPVKKEKKHKMVMPDGCRRKKARDTPSRGYIVPSASGGNMIVAEVKNKKRR